MATCEVSTDRWPTPKGTDGERGGRGDLLAKARGYQMAHNGTLMGDLRQLTLFAAAFPVSRTASPVAVLPVPTTAISGRSSLDSFASLNPDGSWRKTCQGYSQVTLDGSLETFSETWPRAGMTRNGIAYLRPPSAPLTDEIASGLWPTPDAMVANDTENLENWTARRARIKAQKKNGNGFGMPLAVAARMWPMPTSRDWKDGSSVENVPVNALLGRAVAPTKTSGSLNPEFVEYLMAYPIGWTDCADSATPLSRSLRNGSRGGSLKQKP